MCRIQWLRVASTSTSACQRRDIHDETNIDVRRAARPVESKAVVM